MSIYVFSYKFYENAYILIKSIIFLLENFIGRMVEGMKGGKVVAMKQVVRHPYLYICTLLCIPHKKPTSNKVVQTKKNLYNEESIPFWLTNVNFSFCMSTKCIGLVLATLLFFFINLRLWL